MYLSSRDYTRISLEFDSLYIRIVKKRNKTLRRAAWTRREGIVYCALTSGTLIGTICMKSTRLFGTSTPTGNGASRVPWRSARVSYLSSETVRSPRLSSDWLCCIPPPPPRDGVTSCTSNLANGRVRGARNCRISWVYLFSAGSPRSRCPLSATTPPPMRICRSFSCTT